MSIPDTIKREVLPIPDTPYMGLTTFTAKDPDTYFPKFEPLRPPAGAPNVLVILLDDVGFGSSSAFGGPVNTFGHAKALLGPEVAFVAPNNDTLYSNLRADVTK